jgi:hypothetical protein
VVFPDRDHPADPYPGTVPDGSFVHLDEVGHPLVPDRRALAGWRVGTPDGGPGPDLDGWLAARHAAPMAARAPLLVYGSNKCPSKITWLRRELGLDGPVVVLRAEVRDAAAVWAAGLRVRDGQRPATLAAAPGAREWHALWLATPDQVEVLDRCEGRGERYRLARPGIVVRTEDGAVVGRPWTYLGHSPRRLPLLVGGVPVRCADLPQDRARALTGEPADDDGLGAQTVTGAPHPDEWPAALFAYGLLQPGRAGWAAIMPHLAGEPSAARVAGTVYDTGLGWPALLLDDLPNDRSDGLPNDRSDGRSDGPRVVSAVDPGAGPEGGSAAGEPGTLIPLRDPAGLLPTLDAYEGPDYRRARLVLAGGAVAWAYLWVGDRSILRRIAE